MSRPEVKRKVRCAVYTRKSSEEGLELAFNSLDAQREACAGLDAWLEPEPVGRTASKVVRIAG